MHSRKSQPKSFNAEEKSFLLYFLGVISTHIMYCKVVVYNMLVRLLLYISYCTGNKDSDVLADMLGMLAFADNISDVLLQCIASDNTE